jgi:hypothetical protein
VHIKVLAVVNCCSEAIKQQNAHNIEGVCGNTVGAAGGVCCCVCLDQVFDQFDLDGSGKISSKELQALLESGQVSELEGDVSATGGGGRALWAAPMLLSVGPAATGQQY